MSVMRVSQLLAASTNLRRLKSVRALLQTADRLKDTVGDVGGSLEEAGPFDLRRLIERISLVDLFTLNIAVVRHQGHWTLEVRIWSWGGPCHRAKHPAVEGLMLRKTPRYDIIGGEELLREKRRP